MKRLWMVTLVLLLGTVGLAWGQDNASPVISGPAASSPEVTSDLADTSVRAALPATDRSAGRFCPRLARGRGRGADRAMTRASVQDGSSGLRQDCPGRGQGRGFGDGSQPRPRDGTGFGARKGGRGGCRGRGGNGQGAGNGRRLRLRDGSCGRTR